MRGEHCKSGYTCSYLHPKLQTQDHYRNRESTNTKIVRMNTPKRNWNPTPPPHQQRNSNYQGDPAEVFQDFLELMGKWDRMKSINSHLSTPRWPQEESWNRRQYFP